MIKSTTWENSTTKATHSWSNPELTFPNMRTGISQLDWHHNNLKIDLSYSLSLKTRTTGNLSRSKETTMRVRKIAFLLLTPNLISSPLSTIWLTTKSLKISSKSISLKKTSWSATASGRIFKATFSGKSVESLTTSKIKNAGTSNGSTTENAKLLPETISSSKRKTSKTLKKSSTKPKTSENIHKYTWSTTGSSITWNPSPTP